MHAPPCPVAWASLLIAITLAIKSLGYRLLFPDAGRIDAFHQAAMLMPGMGPLLPEDPAAISTAAKIFESFYAPSAESSCWDRRAC